MDSLKKLHEWDLYQAYGKFNILFEQLIEQVRYSIIEIIFYSYDVMAIDDEEEYEQSKPIHILLNNLTARQIIEVYFSLILQLLRMKNPVFKDDQLIIKLYEEERAISSIHFTLIELTVKKLISVVELRNEIIHSTHYDDSILNKNEGASFKAIRHKLKSNQYKKKTAEYTIEDYNQYNENLEKLKLSVDIIKMNFHKDSDYIEECLKNLESMNFKSKLKYEEE